MGSGSGLRAYGSLVLTAIAACSTPRVKVERPWMPAHWIVPAAMNTSALLAARCPLSFPVRIEIEPIAGYWGKSWFDAQACEYRIVVNPQCSEQDLFRETLIHEWAHCMTTCECDDDHCEHWGVNYAACYRATIE